MTIIAVESAPGESRAAAFDEDAQAYAFFCWRDPRIDPRARVGDVYEARVTKIDRGMRGCFLELSTGEIAYCQQRSGDRPPAEGARLNVRIQSEGWADKSTRVSVVTDPPFRASKEDAFKSWRANLPLGASAEIIEDTREAGELIDEAYDEAMNEVVTMDSGGQIIIQATRALTSVDVDSFGRIIRGGTQEINLEAVETLARQVSLRQIGGIVVADLIGAVSGNLATDLVKRFRKSLKRYDRRGANILPINRLGLFEFSLPRQRRPLTCDEFERLSETEKLNEDMLEILRELNRALQSNRSATVEVRLDPRTYSSLQRCSLDWKTELTAQYGGRFKITQDDSLDESGYEVIV